MRQWEQFRILLQDWVSEFDAFGMILNIGPIEIRINREDFDKNVFKGIKRIRSNNKSIFNGVFKASSQSKFINIIKLIDYRYKYFGEIL